MLFVEDINHKLRDVVFNHIVPGDLVLRVGYMPDDTDRSGLEVAVVTRHCGAVCASTRESFHINLRPYY